MSTGKDAAAEEIVVIRRRGGGDDDHHHGGVWKIAYADFMTAMMAFFLVMWLINAANTETKASVASYFNPIKLTENVARKKGLQDVDQKPEQGNKPKGDGAEKWKDRSKAQAGRRSQSSADEQPDAGSTKGSREDRAAAREDRDIASASSRESGQAFRDPFNPMSAAELLAKQEQRKVAAIDKPQSAPDVPGKIAAGLENAANGQAAKELAATADRIRKDVAVATSLLGNAGGPGVDVRVEGDSVVVSLTDTSTFGMFAIGSAEPNADLQQLLRSLAPALSANSDHIILRGHTDARPFIVEGRNNNWRLAMARAEAAYGMLLRSGVDELRFERIEAYADRKPKIRTDPAAAANRRIEIVLRKDR